ncbi:hypothetical protein OOU_Y34scaffold00275g60, partial [Pyricularia oryzae Y34]
IPGGQVNVHPVKFLVLMANAQPAWTKALFDVTVA